MEHSSKSLHLYVIPTKKEDALKFLTALAANHPAERQINRLAEDVVAIWHKKLYKEARELLLALDGDIRGKVTQRAADQLPFKDIVPFLNYTTF